MQAPSQTTPALFMSVDKRDIGMLQSKLFQSYQIEKDPTPSMKISYEINTYKKVSADMFYIIPRGKKCIVWLTMYKNSPEAIFFDLDPKDHTKIKFVSIRTPSPESQFDIVQFQGRGTVLYGTLFTHNHEHKHGVHQLFALENIHVCENQNVDHLTVVQKDELMYKLLSSTRKANYHGIHSQSRLQSRILFGIAVKYASYSEALKAVNTSSIIPYPVYAIQGRFKNQTDNKYYQNCQTFQERMVVASQPPLHDQNQNQNQNDYNGVRKSTLPLSLPGPILVQNTLCAPNTKIFMVKAESRVDRYSLRCPETNAIEPEPAHVGDYKTSVLLNSIFRNVKENLSLDAAEESDDEESFQLSQENQEQGFAIDAGIEKAMVCSYNYKFKRWTPLHLKSRVTELQNRI